jgi:hypothetical protein
MSTVLEANLRALAVGNPLLSAAVRSASADPGLTFATSSSGHPVPLRRDGPALHSRVDPVREARRLAGALPDAGVAVFLGLGAGYLVRAALATGRLFAAVVVERDASVLRSLLGHADVSDLLADPRISVVTDLQAVTGAVLASWAPALMGDLRTVPLRPWCDVERGFFDRAAAAVEASRELASADWAAQARFGRRWFANALLNLPAVEAASLSIPPIEAAIVTGAGPSLDRFASELPAGRRGRLLAATDTSLPALLARGIVPDLAISMDCQQYGYHHLMSGIPADLPLLLDLSSPPLLARSRSRVGFFASGHPLARWFSRHWRSLPEVDTGGGNITHAAVSTVHALGAREVRLAGVDFSCPLGSPYARGTWLHGYHRVREDRCSPAEGRFFDMLVGTPGAVRESLPEGLRYTTPLMAGYRRAFERLASSLDASVLDDWCMGPRLRIRHGPEPAPGRWQTGFAMGIAGAGWRVMLGSYAEVVASLPAPVPPLASWWRGLAAAEREAWQTLLPLLPGMARASDRSADRAALLSRAREWALSRMSLFRAVDDGSVPHE